MFFSLPGLAFTQHGNGIYSGKEGNLDALQKLPVYDNLKQLHTLLTPCDPFRDYAQFLYSTAETHRGNCLKPIHPQTMRMIQSGVRRPLSTSFIEAEEPPVFRNAWVTKPSLIEQDQRLHFIDGCQDSSKGEQNKVIQQEESGEEHKIANKSKSNTTHNITIVQGENVLNFLDPIKIDIEHKNKHKKLSNCSPYINNKEPNPQSSSIKKRRFVIKKAAHRFSPEEDEKLKKLVKCFGESSWSRIAKEMPGLNRKQIRDRYVNYLKKTRSVTEFTAEEDKTILRLVKEKGKCWSVISEELVGRTPIMVKNRFYTTLISTPNIDLDNIPRIGIYRKSESKQLPKRLDGRVDEQ